MSEKLLETDDLTFAIEHLELTGLQVYELRVRRRDGGFTDVDASAPGSPLSNMENRLFAQEDEHRLAVRVLVEHELDETVVTVDLAVAYTKSAAFTMTTEAKALVIERLALPNAFPYIRQHISDLTQRAGAMVTVGLLRPGQGSVVPTPEQDVATLD